jgi:hypothetical protein
VKKDKWYMITTPWTKFFYEYLLEDEQELSAGEHDEITSNGGKDRSATRNTPGD